MSNLKKLVDYLEAIDDFLGGDDWLPTEDQWKKIRAKIEVMSASESEESSEEYDDGLERRVANVEASLSSLTMRINAVENMNRPIGGPVAPFMPSPPVSMYDTADGRDASLMPKTAPKGGPRILEQQDNTFRAPQGDGETPHTGQVSKTPNIDTSSGAYSSPLE